MIKTLNRLGSRITALFGESTFDQNYDLHEELTSKSPLANQLPWEAYDEEKGLFLNKNSVGFTIEAVPLVGGAQEIQKEISSLFQEMLEEGESIQCFLWADHRVDPFFDGWKKARENSKEIYREIAEKRSKHYLDSSHIPSRLFRFIFSYTSTSIEPNTPAYDALVSKREKILGTLNALTYAFAWDVSDFLQNVSALLNFSSEKSVVKRHWNPHETLSGQLTQGGTLKVEEKSINWSVPQPTSLKTFRAVDYPQYWSLLEMQNLIGDIFKNAFRINHPFFIHYGVYCPHQSKEELKFKKRSHFVEKQGTSGVFLRMIPDLQQELDETYSIRKLLSQEDKFVWTQLITGIWSPPNQLIQAEQSLKSLFRINQFTLVENRYLHLPSYISVLPMAWGEYVKDMQELNLLRTTTSSECSALVPLQGEWMGTPTPGLLLSGRRGQLINWNPFDNKAGNYNTVVVGRSGSGKSVFMQDLLLSCLGIGAKVYVLEVGRSFEKLCHLLEGQYIQFAKESPLCLNPFTNISLIDAEERDTAFSFIKSVISTMAAPVDGTSDYENALIEKGVRAAWETRQQEATITDVALWLRSQQDKQAQTLGVMLTPYTKEGVYAKYFEGKNNIDFTNPMVLIELEELKEKKDLQSVVIQLFIMTITNQAFLGDRSTPFFICIDEAWDLLRGKQTGVFIETLARRLRKYYGSLVIGTQSIDDFYTTPGALAAFENSDWMCLLSQKKSSIKRLAESGKVEMDSGKRIALESVSTSHGEYSEIMICDGDGNYSIARLLLDPFSNLLYSTKAQEYAQIKQLKDQGWTVSQAINQLLKNEKK